MCLSPCCGISIAGDFRLTLAVVDTRNAEFLKDVPFDVAVVDLECSRVRYALGKLLRLIWVLRPDMVLRR